MRDLKTFHNILVNESMASSFESSILALDFVNFFSVQAVFTGSPSGTFKIQVSNDVNSSPSNWSDLGDSSQAISAAGDIMWDISSAGYKWAKVVYTRTSGSGTCNAVAITKDMKA